MSQLSLVLLIYIKPYDSKWANNVEIFNEMTVFCVGLHLLTFTEFVPDSNVQFFIGWTLIGVVLLNVGFHLLVITWTLFRVLRQMLRRVMHKLK